MLGMIAACPNNNTLVTDNGGGGTTTPLVGMDCEISTDNSPTKGTGVIYASSCSLQNVSQIALTNSVPDGTIGLATANGGNGIVLEGAATDTNTGGANGSKTYFSIRETSANAAGSWATVWWTLADPFGVTNVANTALKFYIRTPVNGATGIEITVDTGTGINSSGTASKTFTANGNWQEITIMPSEFTANTADNVGGEGGTSDGIPDGANFNIGNGFRVLIIVLNPALTLNEAISVDLDEIQFVTNN